MAEEVTHAEAGLSGVTPVLPIRPPEQVAGVEGALETPELRCHSRPRAGLRSLRLDREGRWAGEQRQCLSLRGTWWVLSPGRLSHSSSSTAHSLLWDFGQDTRSSKPSLLFPAPPHLTAQVLLLALWTCLLCISYTCSQTPRDFGAGFSHLVYCFQGHARWGSVPAQFVPFFGLIPPFSAALRP